ncbi:MAG: TonB-dependent receptor [Alphaproteobacteria bacterium]|nr:TonB-dependent receptor [Alphaproteobacteria bacterium]
MRFADNILHLTNKASHKRLLGLATISMGALMAFILPATVSPVSAQLDEIVVTAERQEANLQDVPVAITALTPSDFATRQITDIADLQSSVPSISIGNNVGTASGARIFLRGVGEDEARPTTDPAVGIYVDGVYLGRQTGALMNLLDLESVEVLRGPQGTLYGRNTNGGAIKLTSKRPVPGENFGKAELTVGSDGRQNMKGSVSVSMGERTAISIAALSNRHDGYFTQQGRDVGGDDLTAARFSLLHEMENGWEIFAAYDMTRDDSDPTPQTPYKGKNGIQDIFTLEEGDTTEYSSEVEQDGLTFIASGEIGSLDVKWLSGWRSLEDDLVSRIAFPFFQNTDQEQTSHELVFSSNYEGIFNWIGGVYYYEEEIDMAAQFYFDDKYDIETTAQALFGQAKFDVTEQTTLTAGVRYTEEEKDFIGVNAGRDGDQNTLMPRSREGLPAGYRKGKEANDSLYLTAPEFENTSYRVGVDHNLTDDVMVFATFATGFKSGGWSPDCNSTCYASVDEEELETFELGVRSEFGNMRLNVTYYNNAYENLQVGGTPPHGGFTRFTIPEASMQGLEAEFSGQVNENFGFYGNAAWFDGEYEELNDVAIGALTIDPSGLATCAAVAEADRESCAKGLKIKNAPEFSLTVGFVYEQSIGARNFQFSMQVAHEDDSFNLLANPGAVMREETTLLDGRIKWTDEDDLWGITLWGKNITDEEYNRAGLTGTSASGSPGVVFAGDPATFGLTISANF